MAQQQAMPAEALFNAGGLQEALPVDAAGELSTKNDLSASYSFLKSGQTSRAIVIDTNVVLDLFVFADPAVAPLRALLADGTLHWIAVPAMRVELERVLSYPQIAPRVAFYGLTVEAVLALYDSHVHWVEPAARCNALCKDPDDQQFLDLAAAHQAVLLSKDRLVLNLRKRMLTHGASLAASLALIRPV